MGESTQTDEDRPDVGFLGFQPLPRRGVIVTDALIDALQEKAGD